MKTKEELVKEQADLIASAQQLDKQQNDIVTRLIEIQGILKYINEEPKKEK